MAGNANSGRKVSEKSFAQSLRLALNSEGEGKRLRNIAEKLVVAAEDGEQWAIREIADRLDGKPPQAIVGEGEDGAINLIHRIERVIVRPKD